MPPVHRSSCLDLAAASRARIAGGAHAKLRCRRGVPRARLRPTSGGVCSAATTRLGMPNGASSLAAPSSPVRWPAQSGPGGPATARVQGSCHRSPVLRAKAFVAGGCAAPRIFTAQWRMADTLAQYAVKRGHGHLAGWLAGDVMRRSARGVIRSVNRVPWPSLEAAWSCDQFP